MTRPPRGLSAQEADLWARVARTVKPIGGKHPPRALRSAGDPPPQAKGEVTSPAVVAAPLPSHTKPAEDQRPRPLDRHGLDASWEKKLARAALHPDFTLDLHGHSLDSAHVRLDHGLAQAAAMGARLVLVITGRPRSAEAADRGNRRGAIRAKLLDWLAAGPHASRIAAVRGAHRRHGGEGAVYIIMKRPR